MRQHSDDNAALRVQVTEWKSYAEKVANENNVLRSQQSQPAPQPVVYERTYQQEPGTTVTREWSLLRPFTVETRRTKHETNDGGHRTIGQRGSITIRRGSNDNASSPRNDSRGPKRDSARPARVERKSRGRGR